jgi:hypothetical protein
MTVKDIWSDETEIFMLEMMAKLPIMMEHHGLN